MKHVNLFPKGAEKHIAPKVFRSAITFLAFAVLACGIMTSSERQAPRQISRWAISKSLHFKPTRRTKGIPDSCFIPDGGVLAGKIVEDRFFLPSGQELSWSFAILGSNDNTLPRVVEQIARVALKVCSENGGCGAYYEIPEDCLVLSDPASGEHTVYWHYEPSEQAFRSEGKSVAIRARHIGKGYWVDYQVDSSAVAKPAR